MTETMFSTEHPTNIATEIVLCVDVTAGSEPHLERLKEIAPRFLADVKAEIETGAGSAGLLRVKIIAFRDYGADQEPMQESCFFTEDEAEDFASMMNTLRAYGGGDWPESALEAVALACKTDWTPQDKLRERVRQIVIVITDSTAHPLGEKAASPDYPADMPGSLSELMDWLNGKTEPDTGVTIHDNGARVILLTPECEPWTTIRQSVRGILYPYGGMFDDPDPDWMKDLITTIAYVD